MGLGGGARRVGGVRAGGPKPSPLPPGVNKNRWLSGHGRGATPGKNKKDITRLHVEKYGEKKVKEKKRETQRAIPEGRWDCVALRRTKSNHRL